MNKLLSIILQIMGILCIIATIDANNKMVEESTTIVIPEDSTSYSTDAQKLKSYLIRLSHLDKPIKFPRVVYAQMIQETGHFTSEIFKHNKNALGMKRNNRGYSRNDTMCYDNVHACYPDLWGSLLDYREWQEVRLAEYERYYSKSVKTEEEYLLFLDNLVLRGSKGAAKPGYRYAEDPRYTQKLRMILRRPDLDSASFVPTSPSLEVAKDTLYELDLFDPVKLGGILLQRLVD